jgi:hypothetical protein
MEMLQMADAEHNYGRAGGIKLGGFVVIGQIK